MLERTDDLSQIFQVASMLKHGGGFLPVHLKSEGEIVAVLLAGRELGLPPMASLRSIHLIRGKVILDASMQLALMVRGGAKVRAKRRHGRQGSRPERTAKCSPPRLPLHGEMATQAGPPSDTCKTHTSAMLRLVPLDRGSLHADVSVLLRAGELEEEPSPPPVLQMALRAFRLPRPSRLTAPEPERERLEASALDLFLPKLRAQKTAADLEAWYREVRTTQLPEAYRVALKDAFFAHARSMKINPLLILKNVVVSDKEEAAR